jgi:hypothetical protein
MEDNMQLEFSKQQPIDNPDIADIEVALAAMEDGDFLILSQDDVHYIQTVPGVVEYRDGDVHYRHEMPEYNVVTVRELFQLYLRGDRAWRTLVEWQDVTQEIYGSDVAGQGAPASPRVALVVVAVIVLAAISVWVLVR